MGTVTPIDIHQRQFRRQLFGYNRDEVDDFLDEIVTAFEDLIKDNSMLKEREKTINATILSAQAASEQITENARKEAELIVEEARIQADRLVKAGEERLRQASLEAANIRRQAQTVRSQLRSFLLTNLELLDHAHIDDSPTLETGSRPSGDRRTDGHPSLEVIPHRGIARKEHRDFGIPVRLVSVANSPLLW